MKENKIEILKLNNCECVMPCIFLTKTQKATSWTLQKSWFHKSVVIAWVNPIWFPASLNTVRKGDDDDDVLSEEVASKGLLNIQNSNFVATSIQDNLQTPVISRKVW